MSYDGDPRDLEPQGKLACGCWDECTGECEEPEDEWQLDPEEDQPKPDYEWAPEDELRDWPLLADDPQSFGGDLANE